MTIPSKGAPLLQVLALPLLTRGGGGAGAAAGHQHAAAAVAAAGSHFGYFPGPLHMPPTHATAAGEEDDQQAAAGGGDDKEAAAIQASVASLLSLPAVKALVGEEGGKRRELVEKGALSAVSMAEKMRRHKYVKPAYEKMMDAVHSREEVLKAADDALAQAHALKKTKAKVKGKGRHKQQQQQQQGNKEEAADDGGGSDDPDPGCLLEVELVYPEGVVADAEGVKAGWIEFVKASEGHHATWKTRSLALLPVTSAFSLLPAPNVFLLWNAFRVYSHLKSTRGAEGLAQGLLQHHYSLKPDAELGRIFKEHAHFQHTHGKGKDHPHAHSGSRHADGKHAAAPAMEEGFEKALAAVGRRYEIDDLPRLYRRWKPLTHTSS